MEDGLTPGGGLPGESVNASALSAGQPTGLPDDAPAQTLPADSSPPPASPVESDSPTDEQAAGETFDPAKYAEWLAKQTPEVVEAEHKRLAKVEAYNKLHQRSIDAGAKSAGEQIAARKIAEMEATQAENERMAAADAWDKGLTGEVRDRLQRDEAYARANSDGRWGASDYRNAFNELLAHRERAQQAPAIERIESRLSNTIGERAQANLIDSLKSHPDLASVGDWEKLLTGPVAEGATPAEHIASLQIGVYERMYRHIEAKVRRELSTKAEADTIDGIAAALGDDPSREPVLVAGAVRSGNGHGSIQSLVNRSADPNQSLTAAEWRTVDKAMNDGIFPKRN